MMQWEKYQVELEQQIQKVWNKWAGELSYGTLARGLMVVLSNRVVTFLRRLDE